LLPRAKSSVFEIRRRSTSASESPTQYEYPNPGWRMGVVGNGPDGRPDPARRVLTFTSAALAEALEISGPILLELYAESTREDTDFIVKLSELFPQSAEERESDLNPRYQIITKGWLRASHRELDKKRSLPYAPWYTHANPRPIRPGQIYKFEIAVMPTATGRLSCSVCAMLRPLTVGVDASSMMVTSTPRSTSMAER
jgi:predicted acyl esterase